jgi:hypothetical protein
MPHFFKNIRRKLAEENKVNSYLRYAVGEILGGSDRDSDCLAVEQLE